VVYLLALLAVVGPFAAFLLGAHVYRCGQADRPVVPVRARTGRLDLPCVGREE
jgi:hypothetical protein